MWFNEHGNTVLKASSSHFKDEEIKAEWDFEDSLQGPLPLCSPDGIHRSLVRFSYILSFSHAPRCCLLTHTPISGFLLHLSSSLALGPVSSGRRSFVVWHLLWVFLVRPPTYPLPPSLRSSGGGGEDAFDTHHRFPSQAPCPESLLAGTQHLDFKR